ncbi:transmembrane protein 41B isoform X1 [Pocillopora verrucosa]|uniref:transmembrane protein 41B isoform X1 n=2 Tax=Pocillopora verrucosa TaxID=203993 RepID=UPI0027972640|nr:transmembrane protein 41B-like isoform X1 [Pocillopora verrucosa]
MTMTDRNFPSELLKLKGRQPLPQNHQNHINNMTDTSPRSFKKETSQKSENNTGPFIVLGLIFLTSLVALAFVYWSFPKLRPEDKARIKLPRDMEDAKGLGRALSNYTDEYFTQVLLGFVVIYIFLQTFAIPGSIFLSILSGFLFPFPLALFFVCLCSSVGASFCYLLFYLVGRRLVKHYMPERVDQWCEQVNHHRDNLLSYIIFLRITPFLPNWFINISSPVIGVPLLPFFVGTFVGVAPPSFGFISAGVELYVLTTTGDVMSFKSIMIVVVSALLSLAPVIFKRQLRAKIE